jgi:hypothetical protein
VTHDGDADDSSAPISRPKSETSNGRCG